MARVAVMGAGSWGTAFSMLCHDADQEPLLWARRGEVADEINQQRTNQDYLPDIELPAQLSATADPAEALSDARIVVLAIPSLHLEEQLDRWGDQVPADATVVSLIKGVETSSRRFASEIVIDSLGGDGDRVVVASGPNLAREVAQRLPAATVAASPDPSRAEEVQQAVMAPYFRVYTNTDRVGVEVGGAVKNVVAMAAGIARGMGFGDNTRATVITRGLAEMQRLGVALGGDPLTFSGLAGVGDLVATCTSGKSRNNTVGCRLGEGMDLDEAIGGTNMVAEGVKSCSALLEIAREHEVEMPLTEGVVRIVHDGLDPTTTVKELLARSAKPEIYGL